MSTGGENKPERGALAEYLIPNLETTQKSQNAAPENQRERADRERGRGLEKFSGWLPRGTIHPTVGYGKWNMLYAPNTQRLNCYSWNPNVEIGKKSAKYFANFISLYFSEPAIALPNTVRKNRASGLGDPPTAWRSHVLTGFTVLSTSCDAVCYRQIFSIIWIVTNTTQLESSVNVGTDTKGNV